MKSKLLLLVTLVFCLTGNTSAQAPPQAVNYQAIARDINGNALTNRHISLRFTINDGTNPGVPDYRETDTAYTNQFGLFTCAIGHGVVDLGVFSSITWATGNKYLGVELDPAGGNNYVPMGNSELLSVPYALYSGKDAGSWGLSGNSGTRFHTNYIGTSDTADFMFKINDTIAGFVENYDNNQSTALGFQALANETPNSYNNNAALGYQALYANTTGENHVAVGYQALFASTTGLFNTACGSWALYANTTGNNNTAIGSTSLVSNITGSNITAVGAYANVADDGFTNATAIGAYAQVGASNSLVLGAINGVNGASSNTMVGIGTTIPTTLLDIENGNTSPAFRLVDGTQAQGNVLTSDAYGNASWQHGNFKADFSQQLYGQTFVLADGVATAADFSGGILRYNDNITYSQGVITVPYSGLYHFDVVAEFVYVYANTQSLQIQTYVNGAVYDQYFFNSLSNDIKLNAGDQVVFKLQQNSGSSQTLGPFSRISCHIVN